MGSPMIARTHLASLVSFAVLGAAGALPACEGDSRATVSEEERRAIEREARESLREELLAELREELGEYDEKTPAPPAARDERREAIPGEREREADLAEVPPSEAVPRDDPPPVNGERADPGAVIDGAARPDARAPGGEGLRPAGEAPEEAPAAVDSGGREVRAGATIYTIPGDTQLIDLAIATEVDPQRQPQNVAVTYTSIPERFFCFNIFDNPDAETTVTHVWRRGDRLVSRVELGVGRSPKWRTWSRQRTRDDWTGPWSCEVLSPEGERMGLVEFEVQ